jgi:hypothetical protein
MATAKKTFRSGAVISIRPDTNIGACDRDRRSRMPAVHRQSCRRAPKRHAHRPWRPMSPRNKSYLHHLSTAMREQRCDRSGLASGSPAALLRRHSPCVADYSGCGGSGQDAGSSVGGGCKKIDGRREAPVCGVEKQSGPPLRRVPIRFWVILKCQDEPNPWNVNERSTLTGLCLSAIVGTRPDIQLSPKRPLVVHEKLEATSLPARSRTF